MKRDSGDCVADGDHQDSAASPFDVNVSHRKVRKEEEPSAARSRTSDCSRLSTKSSILKGTVSILNFDRSARKGPVMNSPRSLLACAQEGLDPNVDFLSKKVSDFMLLCHGDKGAAKFRCEHYMQRRESFIDLVIKRRQRIIESFEIAQEQASKSEQRRHRDTSPTHSSVHDSEDLSMSSVSGSSPRKKVEGKKDKLLRSIHRIEAVIAKNEERQKQLEREAEHLKDLFAAQEEERQRQKAQEELEFKFKEAQIRRRDREERQSRKEREENLLTRLEEERIKKEKQLEKLEQLEKERLKRHEEVQRQHELESAIRQMEIEERIAMKREQGGGMRNDGNYC